MIHTWYIKGNKEGLTTIYLDYCRAHENVDMSVKLREYTVVVDKEGQIVKAERKKRVPDIELITNNTVKIMLEEDMAAGYSWEYILNDNKIAAVKSKGHIKTKNSDNHEMRKIRVWEIKGLMDGITKIKFNCFRSSTSYSKYDAKRKFLMTIEYLIIVEDNAKKIQIKQIPTVTRAGIEGGIIEEDTGVPVPISEENIHDIPAVDPSVYKLVK